MLPNKLTMHVGLIEDEKYKNDKIFFWKDVYGVDMSCMITTCMSEPLVDCVQKQMFVSNTAQIFVRKNFKLERKLTLKLSLKNNLIFQVSTLSP